MKRLLHVLSVFLMALAVLLAMAFADHLHSLHVSAQSNIPITVGTAADLTGNGAAQQLAGSGTARWVLLIADSANAGAVRAGDANVSSSRGARMAPGAGWLFPPSTNVNFVYSLNGLYFYAASGDKISVVYGQ